MRLYKRGDVWHCTYYSEGARVRRSTFCTDRKAAEARARQWERDAADPDHAAAREATLSMVVQLYLDDFNATVAAGRRSQKTADSYTSKAGHLLRVFEHPDGVNYVPFALAGLTTSAATDKYIAQRRGEGASEHTIHKELVVLRGALGVAKSRGLWRGDIDAVVPPRFAPEYTPRTRFLTRDEVDRLMGALRPDRAAVVAFVVATSAEWSAVVRAVSEDVSEGRGSVVLRGTKNRARHRTVPIESADQRRLLDFALDHAGGAEGSLFAPWSNVRRDLHAACARAGIDPCSPHDLRRTFASWMVQDGVPPHLIAKMMGHRTSKMVELVYAQLRPEHLSELVRAALPNAA